MQHCSPVMSCMGPLPVDCPGDSFGTSNEAFPTFMSNHAYGHPGNPKMLPLHVPDGLFDRFGRRKDCCSADPCMKASTLQRQALHAMGWSVQVSVEMQCVEIYLWCHDRCTPSIRAANGRRRTTGTDSAPAARTRRASSSRSLRVCPGAFW